MFRGWPWSTTVTFRFGWDIYSFRRLLGVVQPISIAWIDGKKSCTALDAEKNVVVFFAVSSCGASQVVSWSSEPSVCVYPANLCVFTVIVFFSNFFCTQLQVPGLLHGSWFCAVAHLAPWRCRSKTRCTQWSGSPKRPRSTIVGKDRYTKLQTLVTNPIRDPLGTGTGGCPAGT